LHSARRAACAKGAASLPARERERTCFRPRIDRRAPAALRQCVGGGSKSVALTITAERDAYFVELSVTDR
jgi:hypothetical protein